MNITQTRASRTGGSNGTRPDGLEICPTSTSYYLIHDTADQSCTRYRVRHRNCSSCLSTVQSARYFTAHLSSKNVEYCSSKAPKSSSERSAQGYRHLSACRSFFSIYDTVADSVRAWGIVVCPVARFYHFKTDQIGSGWLPVAKMLWSSFPHVKWILPHAPEIPITLNGGQYTSLVPHI